MRSEPRRRPVAAVKPPAVGWRSDDPAMVLMLTAADAPVDRVSGLGLGADDYLSKPFHFPELVLRLRALARRNPPLSPAS